MADTDAIQFALRLVLAGVFALAGVTKLRDLGGFARAFMEFGGPRRVAKAFSIVVPPLEVAVAVALVPPATAYYGAVGALALLLVFTAAVGLALARGRAPNCHCFGQLRATAVGWPTLARNGVLLSTAVAIIAHQSVDSAWVAASFVAALSISLLAAQTLRPASAARTIAPVPLDSVAPNFAIQDLKGATVTLESLRGAGRPILLLFLGPGCGQCGALLPEVSRWQREYDNVLTVAVVSHGTQEINRAKFGGHGLTHLLRQQGREVNESYGAMATPSAMVVRADGTIGSALARGDVAIHQLVADWTGAPEDMPVPRTAATDAALTAFLRLTTRLDADPEYYRLLSDTAAGLTTWQGLVSAAEAHGLAPLVSFHLRETGIAPPGKVRRELLALSMMHGAANRARFRMLGEILDAFDRAAIPAIVLKGAALAYLLYPAVELRPVGDIELLVAPELAPRAQELIATLGFSKAHRPHAVRRVVGGIEVSVEILTNAVSGDTPASLTLSDLTSVTQSFLIEGRPARALGHADMLFHLCRHISEPASQTRLICVADIVGYATRYRHDIPWAEVRRRYPFVIDDLSRLGLVAPELISRNS